MTAIRTVPYVVGQWVRGERFYGRDRALAEILEGQRESLWLLGTRRIGKTSLLKQLEHVTNTEDSRFVSLFWDFQGADEPLELHLSFHDALLDAEERLAILGVDAEAMDAEDLLGSLSALRRRLRSTGKRLLLLCDEVEELIKLRAQDPSILRKLRRALQSGGEVRSVLTSTIRLWELNKEREDTSPFLHGFTPPIYLATMTDGEARSLLMQEHLPEEKRPSIEPEVVAAICATCANHPFLLQLMGKRYLELGDLDSAIEMVAADEMVSYFFAVDFEMLSPVERRILRELSAVSAGSSSTLERRLDLPSKQIYGQLHQLENLGFLQSDNDQDFTLANSFFQKWIQHSEPDKSSGSDPSTSRIPFSQQITEILSQIDHSTKQPTAASPQELLDAVYDDLRRLAHRYMSRERPGHTLQPTALVHEAYMKLADQTRVEWRGKTHFFAVGAQAMRRILIDHARTRKRNKRGGDWLRVSWAEEVFPSGRRNLSDEELIDLDQAIEELAEIDKRQARVVELRFFGGLTVDEVAEALGVSKRTADGDWAKARTWLKQRLDLPGDLS
jgi:RNA polymerase sigma factor (TIGR02999 family)